MWPAIGSPPTPSARCSACRRRDTYAAHRPIGSSYHDHNQDTASSTDQSISGPFGLGLTFRTLQTATGALLTAFIVSHLNAVFVLGRSFSQVDTTFAWAGGAPSGLLLDPWNVRLIPLYSLAVWLVTSHAGLGLRMVLLNHGRSRGVANQVVWGLCALGPVVSLIMLAALLKVHAPQT